MTQIEECDILIIGAGDVVRHRLLPALIERMDRDTVFRIASTQIDDSFVTYLEREKIEYRIQSEPDIVSYINDTLCFPIIATPSFAHVSYMLTSAANRRNFVVEKPMITSVDDLSVIDSNKEISKYGFALSYYSLEKALPLLYLFTLVESHRELLDTGGLNRSQLLELRNNLGEVRSVKVRILESPSRSPTRQSRDWTEDPRFGGLLFETAIHAFIMLQKICGNIEMICIEEEKWGVSTLATRLDSPSLTRLSGKIGDVRCDVVVGKYIPEQLCVRSLVVSFQNGEAICSLDKSICHLTIRGKRTTIKLKTELDRKYLAQINLVERFRRSGWISERFDEWHDQLVVLRWLLNFRTDPICLAYESKIDDPVLLGIIS